MFHFIYKIVYNSLSNKITKYYFMNIKTNNFNSETINSNAYLNILQPVDQPMDDHSVVGSKRIGFHSDLEELDLKKAKKEFFIENHFNPSIIKQAIERGCRVGSSGNLDVTFFHCGTDVENRYEEIKDGKILVLIKILGV